MKKELENYQALIVKWAKDKNITTEDCAPKQRLKLIEEVGETASAILKENREEILDGIGDIFIVLTILAEQFDEKFELNFLKTDFSENTLDELLSMIIYYEYNVGFEIFIELCKRLDLDIVECVSSAWGEIKDRKGKTTNGVFIKE